MVAANVLVTSKAVWYLMRSSGVVSLVLLTAVMALGIATVNRWRPARRPAFVTPSLHRSISLLAVAFLGVHVVTALADPYAQVGLVAVFVPLAAGAKPFWVGLGALSLDLVAALVLTSLLRRHLRRPVWRALHWAAYLAWPVAFAHGLGMGSDAGSLWLDAVAGACAATVVAAVVWRVVGRTTEKHLERRRPAPAHATAPRPRAGRARVPA